MKVKKYMEGLKEESVLVEGVEKRTAGETRSECKSFNRISVQIKVIQEICGLFVFTKNSFQMIYHTINQLVETSSDFTVTCGRHHPPGAETA